MYRIISQRSTLIVAAPREMSRSGSSETAFAVSCFEVCKTSKLPCMRSVLPRQGQTSCLSGSSRKGDGFILFASAKRTKKQPGLRPATSVQNSMEKYFSWHFLHSSLNRYMVRRAFSEVLNRCERVIVVQTQH